jgi:hypothetical protein
LSPSDFITNNTGKNFVSKEFKKYTNTIDICTKAVPVEAHNSISIVEQYYGLLQRTYQIITVEISDINKDIALQIAFKAINDTAGPDRLVPILLVFSTYLQMVKLDTPSLSVTQCVNAVKKAIVEICKLCTERQVTDTLNI